MMSSVGIDYDGDGNTSEGIYDELVGLRDKLGAAIRTYGSEHDAPICYAANSYPYWFIDGDGDGSCSTAEAVTANAFASWTARLLRATYNFQMASKDPGAFAHNAKYIIELLYDSITDVNGALVAKVDMSKATRTDFGHFNGASEAARHWDQDEQVDATCSSCHGGAGRLPLLPCSTASARWFRRPPTASNAAPATTSPAPTSRRSSRSRR